MLGLKDSRQPRFNAFAPDRHFRVRLSRHPGLAANVDDMIVIPVHLLLQFTLPCCAHGGT